MPGLNMLPRVGLIPHYDVPGEWIEENTSNVPVNFTLGQVPFAYLVAGTVVDDMFAGLPIATSDVQIHLEVFADTLDRTSEGGFPPPDANISVQSSPESGAYEHQNPLSPWSPNTILLWNRVIIPTINGRDCAGSPSSGAILVSHSEWNSLVGWANRYLHFNIGFGTEGVAPGNGGTQEDCGEHWYQLTIKYKALISQRTFVPTPGQPAVLIWRTPKMISDQGLFEHMVGNTVFDPVTGCYVVRFQEGSEGKVHYSGIADGADGTISPTRLEYVPTIVRYTARGDCTEV